MIQRSYLVLLALFASSSVLACDPAQGTGQCGYKGYGGIYNSYGEAQDSYQQQGGTMNNSSISSVRVVKRPDSFAALAQATSGRTFSVTHMHSTTEAKNSVIRKCEQSTGEKCIVAHAFQNGCMSAASGMLKNGRYRLFPASAPTGGEAEVKAMAACKAAGLYDCLLTFEVPECSFF